MQTIDYSHIDKWDEEARRLNGGKGVDFVIEIAGRGTIARSIRSTRQGGLVAVSGEYGPSCALSAADVARVFVRLQSYSEGNLGRRYDGIVSWMRSLTPVDLAKTILYSAANVRGVFVCNRDEFRTMVEALEVGGVKPIVDKVSVRLFHSFFPLTRNRLSVSKISRRRTSTWPTGSILEKSASGFDLCTSMSVCNLIS